MSAWRDLRQKKEGEGVGQEIEILAFDNDARAKLAEQLPRYMQPTLYFSIKYIPSTASGKTDRRQLRNMGASVAQKHQLEERKLQSRRRPSTETEKRISGLWAEVLRVDPMEIGKDSHFIQLGALYCCYASRGCSAPDRNQDGRGRYISLSFVA